MHSAQRISVPMLLVISITRESEISHRNDQRPFTIWKPHPSFFFFFNLILHKLNVIYFKIIFLQLSNHKLIQLFAFHWSNNCCICYIDTYIWWQMFFCFLMRSLVVYEIVCMVWNPNFTDVLKMHSLFFIAKVISLSAVDVCFLRLFFYFLWRI